MTLSPDVALQSLVLLGVWADLRARINRIEDRCFKRLCVATDGEKEG